MNRRDLRAAAVATFWLVACTTGEVGAPVAGDVAPGDRDHSAGDSGDPTSSGDPISGGDPFGVGDPVATGDPGDSPDYCGSLREGTSAWGPPGTTAPGGVYQPGAGPLPNPTHVVAVTSMSALETAIDNAQPGDVITIAPGSYDYGGRFTIDTPGTYADPIFLRAETLGTVTLNLATGDEAFSVSAPHWIFENLVLAGDCQGTALHCEHAFHITGRADRIIIRNNRVLDFVTHVKSNGQDFYDADQGCAPGQDGVQDEFPDDLWFIGNEWLRTYVPGHSAPTNVLNLDGGRRNIVRGNVMAELVRADAGHASGVYPKAGMRDLLVEQNLIVCEKNLNAGNDTAAIYLGDGMSSEDSCDGPCYSAGQNIHALVRNNIIVNCHGPGNSNGFLISSDFESKIVGNSVMDVKGNFFLGIAQSYTEVRSNVLYEAFTIASANNPIMQDNNLAPGTNAAMEAIFADPAAGNWALVDGASIIDQGSSLPELTHDFCGFPREGTPELGAIEYGSNAAACIAQIQALWDGI